MSHDVIMPALGMAQDVGQVVAWRKEVGDPVASGDILMEVETDKAVVEVEAGHDGYLIEIRAEAGAEIPIGDVVAVIGDSPEAAVSSEPSAHTGSEADAGAHSPGHGTVHEVIMPALGMSQDAGQLVAWHKQIGDAVKANDDLMDVETDKAVVQVEAGHDGYLVAIRADAGSEVPVGEVVAFIGDSPDATVSSARSSNETEAAPASEVSEPTVPAQAEASDHGRMTARSSMPTPDGERILASPKARRLAKERGIDLRQLVRQGLPQPFHVADLDKLVAVADRPSTSASASLRAAADGTAFVDFSDWLSGRTNGATSASIVLASFAAGSWRSAMASDMGDRTVVVDIAAPGSAQSPVILTDPDHAGLRHASECALDAPEAIPTLCVRDLSSGPLIEFNVPGDAASPTLTVAKANAGGGLEIRLAFDTDLLGPDAAAAMLTALVERIENPLRHLL
ncbi:MAG: biotin/lipoyl-containing protein [Salinisphaera sp.]|uniref:biotin/lipoyl-containing protein n=1 Tax=Salinisphaera sp. TaxID=1914330 RepID=UPI003C7D57ED